MTHPLTPREKVARAIQAHDNDHVPDGYANGLSDEVSDWSAYLADRVLTALASGSGDHAELARLADMADWMADGDPGANGSVLLSASVASEHASDLKGLLAEIAALRAEHVHLVEQKEGAEDALFNALSRATEAERKLAEAVEIASKLSAAISWLDYPFIDNNTSEDELRSRVGFMMKDAEQPRDRLSDISKEAERG